MLLNFRSTLIFFFTGLSIALIVEFLFRFIATDNPKAFGFAIIFYPIFLIFVLIVGKVVINRICKTSTILPYVLHYIIPGIIGLLIFEWILVGNTPWGNPNSNQIAMFSYWALLGFIPKIIAERRDMMTTKNTFWIKRIFVIHLITYFVVSLVGGFMSPLGFPRFSWIIWSFTISFPLMNFYVIWFIIKLRKSP